MEYRLVVNFRALSITNAVNNLLFVPVWLQVCWRDPFSLPLLVSLKKCIYNTSFRCKYLHYFSLLFVLYGTRVTTLQSLYSLYSAVHIPRRFKAIVPASPLGLPVPIARCQQCCGSGSCFDIGGNIVDPDPALILIATLWIQIQPWYW